MKKIKLNTIENDKLNAIDLHMIKGGNTCVCACAYEGKGGSNTVDNSKANIDGNQISEGYRLQDCKIITIDDEQWGPMK